MNEQGMSGKPNLEVTLDVAISWVTSSERYVYCLNHMDISAGHRRAEALVNTLEGKFEKLLDEKLLDKPYSV